eukprot:SAG31_NODE_269_length_18741_cov_11.185441_5_plen_1316_part_00
MAGDAEDGGAGESTTCLQPSSTQERSSNVSFALLGCAYTVPVTADGKKPGPCARGAQQQKRLLHDVSAVVKGGEMMAVMGPSGAGKSTLLNMLALESKKGSAAAASGSMTLNGKPFTKELFSHFAVSLPQHDRCWAMLTCREHVSLAVELFQATSSASERKAAKEGLLADLGLLSCADTIAGNELIKGLSGGQRRRLSLAVTLAKRPSVIFLDEPTSGLDASGAAEVVRQLKVAAKRLGAAVLCTIHQPSSKIFFGFDSTLVLSGGRMVYCGPTSGMVAHLRSIGRPVPSETNPADHVLEVCNKDFAKAEDVDAVLDAWVSHAPPTEALETSVLPVPHVQAPFYRQVSTLVVRQARLSIKDPTVYMLRIVTGFIMAILIAVLYFETREAKQNQVVQTFINPFFFVSVPGLFAIVSVVVNYLASLNVKREVQNGMYSPMAYVIAITIAEIPWVLGIAFVSLVPNYFLLDWYWPKFWLEWLLMSVVVWVFDAIAQCLSLDVNPVRACLNLIAIWFTWFLLSGAFVPPENVFWPAQIFSWTSPLRWVLHAIMYVQTFYGPEHSGTVPCNVSDACPNGYSCPGLHPNNCFGRTGQEVLNSVHVVYSVYDDEDHTTRDALIVLGMTLFFKVVFALGLMYKCQLGKPVVTGSAHAPSGSMVELQASPGKAAIPNMSPAPAERSVFATSASSKADASAVVDTQERSSNVSFALLGCAYTVPVTADGKKPGPCARGAQQQKRLLHDVSAVVKGGEMMAVMGPSGAGKSTLLNMLALESKKGSAAAASGSMTLNGKPFTKELFSHFAVSLPQHDRCWAMLTCREHVSLAVELFQATSSASERKAAKEGLLADLGLLSCADTIAGNELIKGLSGGQRRRLSLAVTLAKRPSVIFLDEPTSGLDASGAAEVVRQLKVAAKRLGAAVLCTIHQPSSKIFFGFDSTLVLSGGRMVYCGPTSGMVAHLRSIGRPVPSETNPADHVLEVCNKDFAKAEDVDAVLDAWVSHAPPTEALETSVLPVPHVQAPFYRQVLILLHKHGKIALMDPSVYSARMAILLVIGIFFPCIYIETRNRVQDQILQRCFLIFWIVALPGVATTSAVFVYNSFAQTLRLEVKSGMYSIGAFSIASILVELPVVVVSSLILLLPVFSIGGWPWDAFLDSWLLWTLGLWVWESLAQLMSIAPHFVLGMLNYQGMWFLGLLVGGIVIRIEDVVWPFRAFFYIIPYRYLNKAIYKTIFMSTPPYEGAILCDSAADPVGCPLGFTCPGRSTLQGCSGVTGRQMLTSLNQVYEAADPDADITFNVAMVVALMGAFKLTYHVALVRFCRA